MAGCHARHRHPPQGLYTRYKHRSGFPGHTIPHRSILSTPCQTSPGPNCPLPLHTSNSNLSLLRQFQFQNPNIQFDSIVFHQSWFVLGGHFEGKTEWLKSIGFAESVLPMAAIKAKLARRVGGLCVCAIKTTMHWHFRSRDNSLDSLVGPSCFQIGTKAMHSNSIYLICFMGFLTL